MSDELILTAINGENLNFFGEEIKALYKLKIPGRTFFGLVEDGAAAGAAALDLYGNTADLRFFAIADQFRNKGLGREFLNLLMKALDSRFVIGLSAGMFVGEDKPLPEIFSFLSKCGFVINKGNTFRTRYDMKEVVAAAPFGKSELPEGAKLIRGAMADEKVQEKVVAIAEELPSLNSWLDGKLMLSKENRYGGIMLKNGEVSCMISVTKFEDGARLEGLYARPEALMELTYLFDYAVKAITVEDPLPKTFYIDAQEGKLLKFEDTWMKKRNLNRLERQVFMSAIRRIEDEF